MKMSRDKLKTCKECGSYFIFSDDMCSDCLEKNGKILYHSYYKRVKVESLDGCNYSYVGTNTKEE